MWAAHVGPARQSTKDPVSTQFRPTENPPKKETIHMSPMWELGGGGLCETRDQREMGPTWAARMGPTKQPTFDSVSTQFRVLVGVSNSDGCQRNAPADIRSIVSHFRVSRADKVSLGRAIEQHTKLDMCGANPSSLSKTLPRPILLGWVKFQTGWVPFWISIPPAVKAMNELTCFGCTTICTRRRSCYKKGLVCIAR